MNLNVKKGFTLVELLIVVAVIAILASLILANYFEARKQARDERRVIDIEQLQLALRLYVEQYGQQIDCEGGVIFDGVSSNTRINTKSVNTCVDATNILNFIAKNMKDIPQDPLGPGSNDYYYYFDNNHTCNGVAVPIIFAVNLESKLSNHVQVCPQIGTGNNDGGYSFTTGSFMNGTKNPSQPYVKLITFSYQ